MPGPFGFLLELLFLGAERRDEQRQQDALRATLQQVADACQGTVQKPWFGALRVQGRLGDRNLSLIAKGSGWVELRCSTWPGFRMSARRAGWFARLFGAPEVSLAGTEDPQGELASLLHRFGGRQLSIAEGEFVGRFRTGHDARAMRDLIQAVGALRVMNDRSAGLDSEAGGRPTEEAAPLLQVTARSSAPSPSPDLDLRCPFCHDDLGPDALVVHCSGCDAPYHPSCFEEADGCAIPGCQGRKARGGRVKG